MGTESSDEYPKIKKESATTLVRRWQDKAFAMLVALVLALIGTVYGIHTVDIRKADEHAGQAERKVDAHAERTKAEADAIKADQRAHVERIRALEENKGEINRRLDSIDKSLERQDVKHDQVNTKIDKLLDRLK